MKQAFDSFTEPQADRRKFLLGLLFCSAAGVAAWRQPRIKIDYLGKEKLEDLVPKTIGRWDFVTASGLVIPPEDDFEKTLYSQVLTRVYSDNRGTPIMLLLAQSSSQTGFLQVHRPETCYSAGGYKIATLGTHDIQVGSKVVKANLMEAESDSSTEHVIYWTRIGNMMPHSWREQKIDVAEQNLRGIVPDAILVRLSSVAPDGDAARRQIDEFVRAMIESVPAKMRSVFIV